MKQLLAVIIALSNILYFSLALADSAEYAIDLSQIKNKLEAINQELYAPDVEYNHLYSALKELDELKEEVSACLEASNKQLKGIEELLKKIHALPPQEQQSNPYYHYILNKKKLNAELGASCSLLDFRIEETRAQIQVKMEKMSKYSLLEKDAPLWSYFNYYLISSIKIDAKILYDFSGIGRLSKDKRLVLFFLFIGASLGSFFFYWMLARSQKSRSNLNELGVWKKYLLLSLPFAVMSIFIHKNIQYIPPVRANIFLSDAILFYAFFNALIYYYVYSLIRKKSWPGEVTEGLIRRSRIVIFLIFIGAVGLFLFRGQQIERPSLDFMAIMYVTALSLSFFWLSWLIFEIKPFIEHLHSWMIKIIKLVLILVFLLPILFAWDGYQQFALFFIPNVIASSIVFILFWRAALILKQTYWAFNRKGYPLSDKLHAALGLSPSQPLVEIYVIRLIFTLGIFLIMLVVLMYIWGIPQYYIDKIITIFRGEGFTIFDIPIIPGKILRGVFIFCFILIVGRLLATYAARLNTFKGEKERQGTVSTLITYTAFFIGALAALVVAGVNFTGLALAAGALSVGIGFGLQNIANDFVSGIILLINKPVNPGDHVVIDEVEGYVKKIRLLSTQLTTLSRSDVMIPNSHLIGKTITNYTFHHNRLARINIQIKIKNESNVDKAREIIMDVMLRNPNVVQKPPNQPQVLYNLLFSYGASNLILDIWCTIKDVSQKRDVTSEITYHAIQDLKQQGIEVMLG